MYKRLQAPSFACVKRLSRTWCPPVLAPKSASIPPSALVHTLRSSLATQAPHRCFTSTSRHCSPQTQQQQQQQQSNNNQQQQQEEEQSNQSSEGRTSNRAVRVWLVTISGMVVIVIVVGGLTRLTESGLSLVEWKPLGHLPPMSDEEWKKEFEHYQAYPEYKIKNVGMKLDEFKYIYYYEYTHRMLGRVIGAGFVLPAIYFWRRGCFNSHNLKAKMLAIGSLLGFQGFLGWHMVRSGLDEELLKKNNSPPRVSQYRLASHLGTAFLIYGTLLWSYLDYTKPPQLVTPSGEVTQGLRQRAMQIVRRLKWISPFTTALIFTTAMSGAFVAGLDAGLVYNDFPTMDGHVIPPLNELFKLKPAWLNSFENALTVQFQHRVLATTTATVIAGLYLCLRGSGLWRFLPRQTRVAVNLLAIAVVIQYMVGVATLRHNVQIQIASTHQAGAITLLSIALWLSHQAKRLPK